MGEERREREEERRRRGGRRRRGRKESERTKGFLGPLFRFRYRSLLLLLFLCDLERARRERKVKSFAVACLGRRRRREKKKEQKMQKNTTSSPGLGLVDKRPGRQLAPLLAVRVLALGPDLLDDGGLEGLRGDEGGHFLEWSRVWKRERRRGRGREDEAEAARLFVSMILFRFSSFFRSSFAFFECVRHEAIERSSRQRSVTREQSPRERKRAMTIAFLFFPFCRRTWRVIRSSLFFDQLKQSFFLSSRTMPLPVDGACCAHDHDCEAEDCGPAWSLHKHVATARLRALNAAAPADASKLLRPWGERATPASAAPGLGRRRPAGAACARPFEGLVKITAFSVVSCRMVVEEVGVNKETEANNTLLRRACASLSTATTSTLTRWARSSPRRSLSS